MGNYFKVFYCTIFILLFLLNSFSQAAKKEVPEEENSLPEESSIDSQEKKGSQQGKILTTTINGRQFDLFVPKGLSAVRGIFINGPGMHSSTLKYATSDLWQAQATLYGYTLMVWNNGDKVYNGDVLKAIEFFSTHPGLSSMMSAPIVAYGFSAGGGTAWFHVRTIAERIITYTINKGSSSSENLANDSLLVPGLNIRGTLEGEDKMANQDRLFSENRSLGALLGFAVEEGAKHVTGHAFSELSIPYLWQMERLRNPAGTLPLVSFEEKTGWLADPETRTSSMMKIYSYDEYPEGKDKRKACWLPNKDIAYTFSAFGSSVRKLTLSDLKKNKSVINEGEKLSFQVKFEAGQTPENFVRMEFYDYAQKIVELTPSSSMELTTPNLTIGVHSFLVIAYDPQGNSSISNPIAVTVLPLTSIVH